MKKFKNPFLSLALIVSLLFVGCETTSPENASTISKGTPQSYTVYGMDCPGCHGGLEKNLKKIDSVVEAKANWKAQEVTVWVEEGESVSEEEISEAVSNSNFTLGETDG